MDCHALAFLREGLAVTCKFSRDVATSVIVDSLQSILQHTIVLAQGRSVKGYAHRT